MGREEIEKIVMGIAAKAMRIDEDGLTMATRWKEDLGARSANIMKILALVKIRAGLDLGTADVMACDTLGDLADLIANRS